MKLRQAFRPLYLSLALLFACALIGAGIGFANSAAAEGAVTVERAWARPAIQGGNGAVYFVLANHGKDPVTLIGASSDVAEFVEIHETVLIDGDHDDHHAAHDHDAHGHADHHADHHHHDHHGDHAGPGTFAMFHLDKLEIPGESHAEFKPTGLHVMLINLKRTLAWGESFPITLHFADAPSITALVTVGDEPVNDH